MLCIRSLSLFLSTRESSLSSIMMMMMMMMDDVLEWVVVVVVVVVGCWDLVWMLVPRGRFLESYDGQTYFW